MLVPWPNLPGSRISGTTDVQSPSHALIWCPVFMQRSFDVHDTASAVGMALPYMQRRSPVLEVLVHKTLLFVLVNSGLCSVFDTTGEQDAGLLAQSATE